MSEFLESKRLKCKLLVVLPVRDEEHFIRQSIESVQENSPPDTQLLVFDNASNDRTVDEVSDTQKIFPNIHIVCRKGQPEPAWKNWQAAFDAAFKLFDPDFFCFVAGDDWVTGNYLVNAVESLSHESTRSFAYPDFRVGNEAAALILREIDRESSFRGAFMLGYQWERAHLMYSVFRCQDIMEVMSNPVAKLREETTGDWWLVFAMLYELNLGAKHVHGTYMKRPRVVTNWKAFHEGLDDSEPVEQIGFLRVFQLEFLVPLLQMLQRWKTVKSKSAILGATLGTLWRRLKTLIIRPGAKK